MSYNDKNYSIGLKDTDQEIRNSDQFFENQGDKNSACEWFDSEQAANYLKLSIGSLRNMASNGKIPFYKLGRRNRYLRADLDKILLSQKRGAIYGD